MKDTECHANFDATSRIQMTQTHASSNTGPGGNFVFQRQRRRLLRLRQRCRLEQAFRFPPQSLVRTLDLVLLLLVISISALSGSSGPIFASAFSFSWQTTKRIHSTTASTRDDCSLHRDLGSERIRKLGRGNAGSERMHPDWALFSTTERSGHGSQTANNNVSSFSSAPVVIATGEATGSANTNASTSTSTSTNTNTNANANTNTNTNASTNATNASEKIPNRPTETPSDAQNLHSQHPTIPKHVGLICDGNGRWATQRNLPRAAGHLVGARRLVDLIRSLVRERQHQKQKQNRKQAPRVNVGIVDCLTLYAFSTENWTRCPSEIAKIFDAIEFAATAVHTAGDLAEVDLRVLGDLSDERIPASLRNVLSDLEERAEHRRESGNSDRLQVCLAVNYGGRSDIVSACRSLASAVQNGSLEASDISEAMLESRLSTGGIPSPDLIVRTGGEHRLSNFLLWEAAYAELFVSSVLWPDFSWEGEWKRSLDWYSKRKRNFGGRGDDDEAGEQP